MLGNLQITQHTAQVRSATGASVAAVERIEQTIDEVHAIVGLDRCGCQRERTAEVSSEAEETGQRAAEASRCPVPFSAARTTPLRLTFTLDEVMATKFRATLERFAHRQAA